MLEIEVKIRFSDLEIPRSRLVALGAQCFGTVTERDVYYNAPHRDFAQTDEALRVRYSGGRDGVLTYKGAKLKGTTVKAREEHACRLDDGSAMESILSSLGFPPVATVGKQRENYLYKGAFISLDTVAGLGTFVEIEVPGKDLHDAELRIREIEEDIGAGEGTPVSESYLELVLATRRGVQS